MQTPILGQSYKLRSPNAADNRMVNLYPEIIAEGGKQAAYLTRAPGLRRLATLGDGPVRGLWQTGSYGYAVSGNTFYRIDSSWNATAVGSVAGFGPVSMADNGLQIFIAANPYGYIYDIQANTIAQIDDPDFPGAVTVGFIDGYFIFNEPNSQRFWITALYEGDNIDALDFASAEGSPDGLVAVAVDHREAWMFGTNSVEVWYDSGATDFPFERIQGAYNEIGCVAAYSVAKLDNGLFWLGADARGRGIVYRANGYTGQRISTHAVEWAIQQYSDISDAIGYTYQQDGHAFYVLIFPTARTTWVYDVATEAWHERAGWENGEFVRHRSNCQMSFASEIVVGDYNSGKIYAFDKSVYDDDGDIQKWLRSWRALPTGQNDLKRTAQHSLQLDVAAGTATVEDTPSVTPIPWPPAPVVNTYWFAVLDTNSTSSYPITALNVNSDNSVTLLLQDSGNFWLTNFDENFNVNYYTQPYQVVAGANRTYPLTDSSGNTYIPGSDIVSSAPSSFGKYALTKFDPAGTFSYTKIDSKPSTTYKSRFDNGVLDPDGNIIVVGYSRNSTTNEWSLAKYDVSGTQLAFSTFASPSNSNVTSAYISDFDSNGYAYIGLYFNTVTAIVGKIDKNLNVSWVKNFNGVAQVGYDDITATPSGTVYSVVSYSGSPFTSFVISTDTSGAILWQKTFVLGTDEIFLSNVAVDSTGNVYVFGNTAINTDLYIIKLDSSGNILWQKSVSGSVFSYYGSVAIDANDDVYAAFILDAYFIGAIKIPPDGSTTGTYTAGGYSITFATSSCTSSNGALTVSSTSTSAGAWTYSASSRTPTINTSTVTLASTTI